MKMKITKDRYKLAEVVKPTKLSVKKTKDITTILSVELEKLGVVGVSANQLGLTERAFAINVKEPLVLINPKLIEYSGGNVVYVEQCLSIDKTMKKPIKVIRYKSIKIETDNLGTLEFGPDNDGWKTSDDFYSDLGMLESACIQHELDHLNGILITDNNRKYTTTIVNTNRQYGRNERVMVKMSDNTTNFMKYKHAEQFLELGATIL